MFKLMKDFMIEMFAMHIGWQIWLMALMFVNAAMPLFYYQQIEAQLTFIGAIIGMTIGLIIFKAQGFTRLLGLMHLPWFALIFFLWSRLSVFPADTPFGIWLRALILINSVSLIIDTVDVARYIAGDRVRVKE